MTLPADRFREFHEALYGYEPFPWQQMLAERVVDDSWPECIDLPTASGKTACIDVALYALACQADRPVGQRTAPRRIFFVVDRRIVVDAAFRRAQTLASRLRDAENGVLREVAERLRALHGGEDPVAVARIRGGVARDDGWVRSPAQPAVITGTVDQVGSRLLFRAYGPGPLAAPIHAGLVANDSLIVLDEAHCAVPFFQTSKGAERYRGADWAEEVLASPFRVVVMSATPPRGVESVFPEPAARGTALNHPKLAQRLGSAKPAELALAAKPKPPKKGVAGLRSDPVSEDELVRDASDRAVRLAAEGSQRIAVMVNRVATARRIHEQLDHEQLDADVVLMTGRMRPLDRDDLVDEWQADLEAREVQPQRERPVIVVTTQCLEVGADFSFDALITECASLDALRQRFGRLDRLGVHGQPRAAVLIRKEQVKDRDDPIYGGGLSATWEWLNEKAVERDGRREFDFGIEAVEALLPPEPERRRGVLGPLLAPAPDAPVMLPAHLDCWVQTAPRPRPDPDVAVFLHGPARGDPDIHVVLRADLDAATPDQWAEIVSLCPPSSLEAFTVPIRTVRRWLAGDSPTLDDVGDVEGGATREVDEPDRARRAALVWRGREKGEIARDPRSVRPYEVVVVPASAEGIEAFGDIPARPGGIPVRDLGDRAALQARGRALLRVEPRVLGPWARHPAIARLLAGRPDEDEPSDIDTLGELLRGIAQSAEAARLDDGTQVPPPPEWMRRASEALAVQREVLQYPDGAAVLVARRRLQHVQVAEQERAADADDLTSEASGAVPLAEHLQAVGAVVREFGQGCLPPETIDAVVRAAELHDLGKADWRFQVMLNRGNELEALRRGELLAKSEQVPRSRQAGRRARQLAGLPDGFRHEMVSMQIAEADASLLRAADAELVLHLIGSHHGYGRPFAPVVLDDEPPDLAVDAPALGVAARLTAEDRRGLVPPHRLDSGVAERFWRLTRRYGWWGLAYLEAIMRLADWEASARHEEAIARMERPTEGVA